MSISAKMVWVRQGYLLLVDEDIVRILILSGEEINKYA